MGGGTSMDCPEASMNPQLDASNKQASISDASVSYTDVGGTSEQACGNCNAFDVSQRMQQCIQDSTSQRGYCWTNSFVCSAAGICNKWKFGGAITDDQTSYGYGESTTPQPVMMDEPNLEQPEMIQPEEPMVPMMKFGGEVKQLKKRLKLLEDKYLN